MELEIVGHDGICLRCDYNSISVVSDDTDTPIIKSLDIEPSSLVKYKFNQMKLLSGGKYLYQYNDDDYVIEKIQSDDQNAIDYNIYGPEDKTRQISFYYNGITYTCTDVEIKPL